MTSIRSFGKTPEKRRKLYMEENLALRNELQDLNTALETHKLRTQNKINDYKHRIRELKDDLSVTKSLLDKSHEHRMMLSRQLVSERSNRNNIKSPRVVNGTQSSGMLHTIPKL